MNQYVLLLHERPADNVTLSPSDMKELVQRYNAWARGLAEQGLLSAGEKLCDDGGRRLQLSDGQVLASDGPYAEAQDVIGGLFIIKAEDDAHAERLAATCPHLRGRQWVEIRRVDTVQ